jgi:cytochrome c oxidase assembly protein subunit 15
MQPDRLKTFARLALATTIATYLLIVVGALVRASGAGLGCPDWPRCYGLWIPPTSVSQLPAGFDPATFNAILTWTEYSNRLLGMSIGLLITATVVAAIRWHRREARILWPSVAALFLVGFEGWLGGQVVRSGLEPWMISAHLIFALLIVTLLLYATFVAFRLREPHRPPAGPERVKLVRFASAVIGTLLLQVYLGTLVRGGMEVAVSADPELPRSAWLAAVASQDQVHRGMAILVVLAVGALMLQIRTHFARDLPLVRWATVAAILAAGQVAIGMTLSRMALPPAAQVLHLSIASLLLGALVVVTLLAGRGHTSDQTQISV